MSDTLEIRRFESPCGHWQWGVFKVVGDKLIANYPEQEVEAAYAFAFGYLNEHIRNLNADIARLTETNNALNKRMSAEPSCVHAQPSKGQRS